MSSYLSVCPSVCQSVCQSVCVSVCLSVSLSHTPQSHSLRFISITLGLFVTLSLSLSFSLFLSRSFYHSLSLSWSLPFTLSLSLHSLYLSLSWSLPFTLCLFHVLSLWFLQIHTSISLYRSPSYLPCTLSNVKDCSAWVSWRTLVGTISAPVAALNSPTSGGEMVMEMKIKRR